MSKEELIKRGHAILDEAPRDYSAITNLVVDALADGWDEGKLAGAQEEHEMYIECTRDPENPDTFIKNPYREEPS